VQWLSIGAPGQSSGDAEAQQIKVMVTQWHRDRRHDRSESWQRCRVMAGRSHGGDVEVRQVGVMVVRCVGVTAARWVGVVAVG
jgi:hypothetical protein